MYFSLNLLENLSLKSFSSSVKNKSHFTSNVNPPTFPDGLDVQVSTFKTLEKIWKIAKKPYHREHVFTYLEENQFVKINHFLLSLTPAPFMTPTSILRVSDQDQGAVPGVNSAMHDVITQLSKRSENHVSKCFKTFSDYSAP